VRRDKKNSLMRHVHQPPPPVLYHYTSLDVLEKITKTGSVWASDIDFLNDSSEFVTALSFIKEEIESRIERDLPLKDAIIPQLKQLSLDPAHPTDLFVTSLSTEGDSLPQWRAYCPSGLGVAIGFLPWALKGAELEISDVARALHKFPTKSSLIKCVYTTKEKRKLLDDYLEHYFVLARTEKQGTYESATFLQDLVLFCSPFFKNESFREEREWRLAVTCEFKDIPTRHFRIGRSTIVPFIKLDLKTNYRLDFIKEIVIGPTPNKDLAYRGVATMLSRRGLHSAQVRLSNIPYRTW
jgi:hypothetical protein